jgi:hypothetical protein
VQKLTDRFMGHFGPRSWRYGGDPSFCGVEARLLTLIALPPVQLAHSLLVLHGF